MGVRWTWTVWWWRIITGTPPTSAAATTTVEARASPCVSISGITTANNAGGENHPKYNTKEDQPEEDGYSLTDLFAVLRSIRVIPVRPAVSVFLQALGCQHQAVFNTAATFQDVGIVGRVVTFADDVGGGELEFFGKGGLAGPLYVLVIVVGTGVLAAHHIDFVKALRVAADACELWAWLISLCCMVADEQPNIPGE